MTLGSLSNRITLLLLVTGLAVMGAGALLMDWRMDDELEAKYQQTLLAQARTLAALVELEEDAPDSYSRASLLAGETPALYELRCPGWPPLRSDPAPTAVPAGWPAGARPEPRFSRVVAGGVPLGSVMFTFDMTVSVARDRIGGSGRRAAASLRTCALLYQQDRRPFEQILLALDWILALGPALAACIALAAVPWIVRRGLRPVRALVERMAAIGPNAPGGRLQRSGLRELDPLVDRFNEVLARMDEGLARERQFASGLAHETRTRLAELRALTEVETRFPTGRTVPELMQEVGHIGAELEATVTALLLLTRLQGGLEHPRPQSLDLASWLERIALRHRQAAAARGVRVDLVLDQAGRLDTDPALLELIVGNLLGNACAYAPEGDAVCVRVEARAIRVDNAAPTLQLSDLPSLGQRFWRKQPEHPGHAGLGLALAFAAAEALGMRLTFQLGQDRRLYAEVAWR